jgi:hypothetical protein
MSDSDKLEKAGDDQPKKIVTFTEEEVIDLLKTLEGLKRKLHGKLKK